jgi:hypothetical protein
MTSRNTLEAVANELIDIFEIKSPPVPIENILQHPKPDMWNKVDITKLSSGFLMRDAHSPRMSLARLLVRHIVLSHWGRDRNVHELIRSEEDIHTFARMLMMPQKMIAVLSSGARTAVTMAFHFEVPEQEARLRLEELNL